MVPSGVARKERWAIQLDDDRGAFEAIEPTAEEVRAVAERLSGFYNEPYNQAMLAHEQSLSRDDVLEHYRDLSSEGARPFLLYWTPPDAPAESLLVGDADLRRLRPPTAEAAILIGERRAQGRGLGTRFGVMLHAFAFAVLKLQTLYASIIPDNAPSLRLFEKLGYERDVRPAARRYADEDSDVTLSVTAARFEGAHGALAAAVRFRRR
jgi:RimJ/RimL family protein N-acetyltransferase